MNSMAFVSYVLLTALTPGPNNIMAMTNAANRGMRRAAVFCFGVLLGFFIDMTLCAAFISVALDYIPAIEPMMKWIGAGYILLLAYSIVRDKPAKAEKKRSLRPDSVFSGMILQLVNVKVILYGITAMSAFVLPTSSSVQYICLAVVVLSLMGFVGTMCWACFGAAFQWLFQRYQKQLNIVMALLLVYCAVVTVI